MAASTCVGTPGQSWLMNRGCPAPPVAGDGLLRALGTCRVDLVPTSGLCLAQKQQACGRAQHPGPLTPCSVLFLLAFLPYIPPHLPQPQPLLLPAVPLAVLGKVQCVGSRWTSPQRSTETKSGLSKQLLIHSSAITVPSGQLCPAPPRRVPGGESETCPPSIPEGLLQKRSSKRLSQLSLCSRAKCSNTADRELSSHSS